MTPHTSGWRSLREARADSVRAPLLAEARPAPAATVGSEAPPASYHCFSAAASGRSMGSTVNTLRARVDSDTPGPRGRRAGEYECVRGVHGKHAARQCRQRHAPYDCKFAPYDCKFAPYDCKFAPYDWVHERGEQEQARLGEQGPQGRRR
eukprot:4043970-Pyramimonas_sp.AAC.1